MNGLPLHLLDEILFRMEPISLAIMRCTNSFFRLYISDPKFDSNRFYVVGTSLFHLSSYGAHHVYCLPFVSPCVSMSRGKTADMFREYCYIFGSCSGLLLLYIGGLFIANPLTKKFRILDHTGSKVISEVVSGDGNIVWDHPEGNVARTERAMCVGFTVDRIQNRTTKRFKIVCILEMQTMYGFEISDGNSWRLSKTTVTRFTNNAKTCLTRRMKPVYLNDTFHWLRNDGSIIVFNPDTEDARLIPSKFHQEPNMNLFFGADNNNNLLTLISGTKETISVYTLLKNHKWELARQIKNISMEESIFLSWNVAAYDGKRLVVRKKQQTIGTIHVYDMETNSWVVMGSTTTWSSNERDFYKFKPSLFFVEEDVHNKVAIASNDLRISYLTKVMKLIDTTK